MIDGQQADDKIIAVLISDVAYGHIEDISGCPTGLVDRLKHYFLIINNCPRRHRVAWKLQMLQPDGSARCDCSQHA